MRFLLGIILALSVSFACDQPHEEVGGYKIGCYLNPAKMPYDKGSSDENIRVLSNNNLPSNSFFQVVVTTLLFGNIEKIQFSRSYPDYTQLSKDRLVLLNAINDRWGEYQEISPNVYLFGNIDSPVLDHIVIDESLNSNTLSIVYISKKIEEYRKKHSLEDTIKKTEQLIGF
ncbi:hypothetical protein [Wohlfahrtiimonas populi]|uniref:hypothetical protein n=1 Tax=Wohlfahrtiimonas populi TaxID=1940240 RepID=UPI00098D5FB2|nr:hypothetical protein [Wohlfahrtiimonas populi]